MKMNKKIVVAAVSAVMAGTMAFSFTACGPKGSDKTKPNVDGNGKLTYSSDTTLKFDIGDKAERGIAYTSSIISGTIKLLDGKTYTSGDLKPAWKAMSDKLGFNLVSTYSVDSNKYADYAAKGTLGNVNLFTDSVSNITTAANANPSLFLNLGAYLEYMPNFKAFIEADTATYMSLVSNPSTGAFYYAPYYDGNNDIEKYVLTKTNWVSSLLDAPAGDTETTWAAQLSAKTLTLANGYAAESFMGKTGSWTVDTLASDSADANVVTLKVNYGAALTAANNSGSELGAALADAGVTVGSLTSGNIVDLQNEVLKVNQNVTGAKLLKILQAYIDVAYQTEAGAKFYAKRSEVYNGYNAGWDVDLLTATYRCLVTNPSLLLSGKGGHHVGQSGSTPLNMLYGLCARQPNMQRQSDIYAFAGELYGVRGLESRYEFSYIDSNGVLQDARAQAATYDAMDKMNKLVKEGLLYTGETVANGKSSYYSTDGVEALMIHDYVNTQTPTGYEVDGKLKKGTYDIEEGYYFTPIITPVSKWNDGTEQYMRFTESWRATKNSGFAIPAASINSSDQLSAILAFIDYLYSEDGQLAMTYGPKATNKTGDGGFWYNEEASAAQVSAGTYFEYEGKKYYSETYYAGKYQPTLTDNVLKAYEGTGDGKVNDVIYNGKMEGDNAWKQSCQRNYTNFARFVIGSALAIGNKLQSFEYQATSGMGKYGASVVDTAITKGVIKHTIAKIAELPKKADKSNNLWYLISPSALPLTQAEAKYINDNCTNLLKTLFTGESGQKTNYLWAIMQLGLGATGNDATVSSVAIGADAAACVSNLTSQNIGTYVQYKQDAFDRLKAYFTL